VSEAKQTKLIDGGWSALSGLIGPTADQKANSTIPGILQAMADFAISWRDGYDYKQALMWQLIGGDFMIFSDIYSDIIIFPGARLSAKYQRCIGDFQIGSL